MGRMAANKGRTAAQQARERARLEREAAAAKARRQKTVATVVIGVVVLVIIAGMGSLIWWQKSKSSAPGAAPAAVAPPYTGAGATPLATPEDWEPQTSNTSPGMQQGIGTGSADAPVTVELFEDFSCPHCQELEKTGLSGMLAEYLKTNDVRVVTYPVSLPMFGRPSELAANALACSAATGKAMALHNVLYQDGVYNQQWTASTLIAAAKQAGIKDGRFASCVRNETYADWARSIDDYATLRGVAGTPTVMVNGTVVGPADMSADGIRLKIGQALEAAKK
jgi:protein-disulfide isomerase